MLPLILSTIAISVSGVYAQQVQGCPSGSGWIPMDNGDCKFNGLSAGAWAGLSIGIAAVLISFGVAMKILRNRRARFIQEAMDVERATHGAKCYPHPPPVADAVSSLELPAYVPNPPAYLPSDVKWDEHTPAQPSLPPMAHHQEALHYSPQAFLATTPMGYKGQELQDASRTSGH
ncbi:hypothetical protein FRB94_013381 [Tulasnella sp. JGI-2019a]|nr:hypothetical protein FRB93_002506 [Tulasnella sp. JGI-2019a]KAG9008335.1 hypothetical protein FRB94_013381 [Tulasnella sp. JGI-2019a]KAG9037782.1 hypothetical protein FRB95_004068 [Tulasnella sp. JGI-2019a]